MNSKNVAFWIMTCLVIALCIYAIHWIRTESFQCVSNPYVYSIKLLEKANHNPVSCLCSATGLNSGSVILDSQGFHPVTEQKTYIGSDFILPNITSGP